VLSVSAKRKSIPSQHLVNTRKCAIPQLNPEARRIPNVKKGLIVEWNMCVDIVKPHGSITIFAPDGSGDPEGNLMAPLTPIVVMANVVEFKHNKDLSGKCRSTSWTIPDVDLQQFTCGRVGVSVQGGTVQDKVDVVLQPELQTAYLHLSEQCPRFRSDSTCWLLWDKDVVEQRSDAQHLVDDLDFRKIPYVKRNDLSSIGKELSYHHFLPWCIIIPELRREFLGKKANGRQYHYGAEVWDDYVDTGGILIAAGGARQIAVYNEIFNISMVPGFFGNYMARNGTLGDLYNGPDAAKLLGQQWEDFDMNLKKFPDSLPPRNGMRCVGDLKDVQNQLIDGHRHKGDGRGIAGDYRHGITSLYMGTEGVGAGSEGNQGTGVLLIKSGKGFATYVAFDWHEPSQERRTEWMNTFEALLFSHLVYVHTHKTRSGAYYPTALTLQRSAERAQKVQAGVLVPGAAPGLAPGPIAPPAGSELPPSAPAMPLIGAAPAAPASARRAAANPASWDCARDSAGACVNHESTMLFQPRRPGNDPLDERIAKLERELAALKGPNAQAREDFYSEDKVRARVVYTHPALRGVEPLVPRDYVAGPIHMDEDFGEMFDDVYGENISHESDYSDDNEDEEQDVPFDPLGVASRRLVAPGDPLPGEQCPSTSERYDLSLQKQTMRFKVDVRCPSMYNPKERFDGAKETALDCHDLKNAMQAIIQPSNHEFSAAIAAPGCMDLRLVDWSMPAVMQVNSPCEDWSRIRRLVSYVNSACNFTFNFSEANLPYRYTDDLSWLERNLVQSRQGVESFSQEVRSKTCERPTCRRMVYRVAKQFAHCPNSAGLKGKTARSVKALRNVMKSCSKVKAPANLRTQIMVKGLNTVSPEEMHEMQGDFRRIIGDFLNLTGIPVDPLQDDSLGNAFGGMLMPGAPPKPVPAYAIRVSVLLSPIESDLVPDTGRITKISPMLETLWNTKPLPTNSWTPNAGSTANALPQARRLPTYTTAAPPVPFTAAPGVNVYEQQQWWPDSHINESLQTPDYGSPVENVKMISIQPAFKDVRSTHLAILLLLSTISSRSSTRKLCQRVSLCQSSRSTPRASRTFASRASFAKAPSGSHGTPVRLQGGMLRRLGLCRLFTTRLETIIRRSTTRRVLINSPPAFCARSMR
jgi:hypothetical protein